MKLTNEQAHYIFAGVFQFEGDYEGLKELDNYLNGRDPLVKTLLNIKENSPELATGDLWDELIEEVYKKYDVDAEDMSVLKGGNRYRIAINIETDITRDCSEEELLNIRLNDQFYDNAEIDTDIEIIKEK